MSGRLIPGRARLRCVVGKVQRGHTCRRRHPPGQCGFYRGDRSRHHDFALVLDTDDLEDSTDYQRFGEGIPEPVAVPGRINTRQPTSP